MTLGVVNNVVVLSSGSRKDTVTVHVFTNGDRLRFPPWKTRILKIVRSHFVRPNELPFHEWEVTIPISTDTRAQSIPLPCRSYSTEK